MSSRRWALTGGGGGGGVESRVTHAVAHAVTHAVAACDKIARDHPTALSPSPRPALLRCSVCCVRVLLQLDHRLLHGLGRQKHDFLLQGVLVVSEDSKREMLAADRDQQFANNVATEFGLLLGRSWRQASRDKIT